MKEINMTKAISCMPDKFITMEMVELAATEHLSLIHISEPTRRS